MECLCLSILIITSPSYKRSKVLWTGRGSFNQPCLCILLLISPVLSSVLTVRLILMTVKVTLMVEEFRLPGPSRPETHETKMCQIEVIIGPFDEKEMQFLLVWALVCTRLKSPAVLVVCFLPLEWNPFAVLITRGHAKLPQWELVCLQAFSLTLLPGSHMILYLQPGPLASVTRT